MTRNQDIYDAHQRARFMRPDAARFVRPDVARFLRPGIDPADVFPALDRKYSPSQRRIPAGRHGGGRWTDEEGGDGGGGAMPTAANAGVEGELSGELLLGDSAILSYSEQGSSLPIDTTDWGIVDVDLTDQAEIELPPIDVAWRGPPITDSWGEPYYNPAVTMSYRTKFLINRTCLHRHGRCSIARQQVS